MVELSDLDNEVLVKLVGGDLVETVVAHDVIGRLMIQCARQPGLAQVSCESCVSFCFPLWLDFSHLVFCYLREPPMLMLEH